VARRDGILRPHPVAVPPLAIVIRLDLTTSANGEARFITGSGIRLGCARGNDGRFRVRLPTLAPATIARVGPPLATLWEAPYARRTTAPSA